MRASFGGSADLSQQLAIFYGQYADHMATLTQQAANRATDEEAATDQDKINAWQSGDLSDAEIIAYLKGRIGDSTNDPKVATSLKDALRNVQDAAAQQKLSDTAQGIMDGINNGTKTWNDLKNFYVTQRRAYRPNDPIYKSITDQITQVDSQIRDNTISGGVERTTYLFENKQLTGVQAGAQLRKVAAAYKNSDPAKYYQLLQQATQLEAYGSAYYGASSGGSGGGSGGGGGGRSASGGGMSGGDLVNLYQAQVAALKSLGEQFDGGASVGTDSQGNTYLLANSDGSPSQQMQSIDQQALDSYDLLIEANRSLGTSAGVQSAEVAAAAKQSFIQQNIQPRNTIAPEHQRTALLDGIAKAIDIADASNNPTVGAAAVRKSVDAYNAWVGNLNTQRTFRAVNRVEKADTVGNPEGRRGLSASGQVTADFVKESQGISAAFEQAFQSGDPASIANIDLPAGMSNLKTTLENGAAFSQLLSGLADGSFVWVMAEDGPHALPTITDLAGNKIPVDKNGNPLVDDASKLVQIPASIGGQTVPAFAVPTTAQIWNGADIHSSVDGSVVLHHGESMTTAQISQLKSASSNGQLDTVFDGTGVQNISVLAVRDDKGNAQIWYGSDQGWSKGKLGTKPGDFRPAPIIADSDRAAQQIADKLQLDPTGAAYYAPDTGNGQLRGGRVQGADMSQPSAPPQQQPGAFRNPASGQSLAQNPMFQFGNQPRGAGGSFDLPSMAQKLGISVRLPTTTQKAGFFENSDLTTKLPKVNSAQGGFFAGADITGPRVNLKPINLPSINIRRVDVSGIGLSTEAEALRSGRHLAGPTVGGLIR